MRDLKPHPTDPSGWVQTFTGRAFTPLNPQAEDLCIEDIAHALSLQCRFTGHCKRFYSVAEHSVRVMWQIEQHHPADASLARVALMHDATEAYLIDLARPVKRDPRMRVFTETEASIEVVIKERFNLYCLASKHPTINDADFRMCNAERLELMGPEPYSWGPLPDATGIYMGTCGWAPSLAENLFLNAARRLGIK